MKNWLSLKWLLSFDHNWNTPTPPLFYCIVSRVMYSCVMLYSSRWSSLYTLNSNEMYWKVFSFFFIILFWNVSIFFWLWLTFLSFIFRHFSWILHHLLLPLYTHTTTTIELVGFDISGRRISYRNLFSLPLLFWFSLRFWKKKEKRRAKAGKRELAISNRKESIES